MAEGVFSKMVADRKQEEIFSVGSAGTVCYQKGAAPDSRAVTAALAHGIDISAQKACCIRDLELGHYTRIFAMDDDNFQEIIQYGGMLGEYLQVSKVADYLSDPFASSIEDPYYGTTEDFFRVFRQLHEALGNIYDELLQ